MPLLTGKHPNAQRVIYPSFDGGLNLSVPNESLAQNELKEALNVEFSNLTGSLRVRGGLVWTGRFNGEIGEAVPVFGGGGFLARIKNSNNAVYFTSNCTWDIDGTFSSDSERLSAAAWGEHGEHVIACGGKLQLFDPVGSQGRPEITTIANSPDNCRLVFVKDGRVGVISGDDTIRFSAIGDCESWENDPDDLSSGQFIDIGYKDGMNITAAIPLSRDLIIFKSPPGDPTKGTIWRLIGNSPSEWQAAEAAHNTGTFSQNSVQAIANDVYYLTPYGLANLSSVTAYGEVKTSWPDRKVASELARKVRVTCQLWNMPLKQQLWILTQTNEPIIWIYDYGRGIWTQFEFPVIPAYVSGSDRKLYVFIGRDLYQLEDAYTQDELYLQTPREIKAKLRFGTILRGMQTLIKAAFISFVSEKAHGGDLNINGFIMPFTADVLPPYYIYANSDKIYGNTRPILTGNGVLTARRRCLVRGWAVTPRIEAYGGFALSTMGFEIAEV